MKCLPLQLDVRVLSPLKPNGCQFGNIFKVHHAAAVNVSPTTPVIRVITIGLLPVMSKYCEITKVDIAIGHQVTILKTRHPQFKTVNVLLGTEKQYIIDARQSCGTEQGSLFTRPGIFYHHRAQL